jgi:NADH-quinone oxidoreductase subunit E
MRGAFVMAKATRPGDSGFDALLERLRPECDRIIAQYEHKRSALLPIMHLFQEHEGFVSPEAMAAAARMLDLTPAEVESTVSFYTLLYRKPVGRYMLQVCRGLSCVLNGADEFMAHCRTRLGIGHLETTDDGTFSYEEVECLAACDRAPCMQVNLEFFYDLTPERFDQMLDQMRNGVFQVPPLAQTRRPERTWLESPQAEIATGRRTRGAERVPDPDDPGGIGDRSGLIMLDRILARDQAFRGRTRERLVREDPQALERVVED